jgi:inorganic triphosphatase YgiF
MAFETELKLGLAARDVPLLLAHPLLAGSVPQRHTLFNTYFDTPALALLARRMAVRERRIARQTLLTVKTAGTVIGGLARRGEWEAPTEPGRFDFMALVNDTALAGELQALAGTLVPVFTTDFTRRTWLLTHRRALIEVALDRGRITSTPPGGPRSLPLLELELELKRGPVDALFSLARTLGQAVCLHPVTASKAQRGYALFQGRQPTPEKAAPAVLDRDQAPVEAFRTIALGCLAHLQANEAGVLHSDDPEFLHQARVALRRLRAALRVFAPLLPPRFATRWGRAWQALGQALGDARNWDVLDSARLPEWATLLNPSEAARLARWARTGRTQARAAARHSLQDRGHADLLLAFTQAVLRLPAGSATATPGPVPRLKPWARERLQWREHHLQQQLHHTVLDDSEARHRLRIEAKKLRYALDFFASLWPDERLKACASALAQVQEQLGTMNDLVTAQTLLDSAPPALAARLQAALAQQLVHETTRLPAVLSALKQAKAPWK